MSLVLAELEMLVKKWNFFKCKKLVLEHDRPLPDVSSVLFDLKNTMMLEMIGQKQQQQQYAQESETMPNSHGLTVGSLDVYFYLYTFIAADDFFFVFLCFLIIWPSKRGKNMSCPKNSQTLRPFMSKIFFTFFRWNHSWNT